MFSSVILKYRYYQLIKNKVLEKKMEELEPVDYSECIKTRYRGFDIYLQDIIGSLEAYSIIVEDESKGINARMFMGPVVKTTDYGGLQNVLKDLVNLTYNFIDCLLLKDNTREMENNDS